MTYFERFTKKRACKNIKSGHLAFVGGEAKDPLSSRAKGVRSRSVFGLVFLNEYAKTARL